MLISLYINPHYIPVFSVLIRTSGGCFCSRYLAAKHCYCQRFQIIFALVVQPRRCYAVKTTSSQCVSLCFLLYVVSSAFGCLSAGTLLLLLTRYWRTPYLSIYGQRTPDRLPFLALPPCKAAGGTWSTFRFIWRLSETTSWSYFISDPCCWVSLSSLAQAGLPFFLQRS